MSGLYPSSTESSFPTSIAAPGLVISKLNRAELGSAFGQIPFSGDIAADLKDDYSDFGLVRPVIRLTNSDVGVAEACEELLLNLQQSGASVYWSGAALRPASFQDICKSIFTGGDLTAKEKSNYAADRRSHIDSLRESLDDPEKTSWDPKSAASKAMVAALEKVLKKAADTMKAEMTDSTAQ